MATSRESKAQQLEEIRTRLKESSSFILLDYIGITVADDTVLRKTFRAKGVHYKVYKNRLLKLALNEIGLTDYDKFLEGTTAVAFGSDPAFTAAAVLDSMKSAQKLKIKCGSVENEFIDANGVRTLAALPSKEVLLAMLLGVMQAPVRGLAVGLNATIAGLARALQAVADKS